MSAVINPIEFPWEIEPKSRQPRLAVDFTHETLSQLFLTWGLNQTNADRFFRGLHKLGFVRVEDFASLQLPKRLLREIESGGLPLAPFREVSAFPSDDGSVKYRFTLHSGHAIESVFMPFEGRTTLCLSSQAGCAMGCTFCATGKMGLLRHLSVGEIVGQANEIMRRHPFTPGKRVPLKIVFMGMGEPLHNLENVMGAFEILTHRLGLDVWDRDVAVSTSGLVPKIQQLARLPRRPQLMVSIAATSDAARSTIMPVNRAYPLARLRDCLANYPLRKREKIMFSYVLIDGVNDSAEDVARLADLASVCPSMINLIPMNEHKDSPDMREPDEARLQWFTRELLQRGQFVTIRRSKGRDVAAACGQLVRKSIETKPMS